MLTGWGATGQCVPGQGACWQDSTDSGWEEKNWSMERSTMYLFSFIQIVKCLCRTRTFHNLYGSHDAESYDMENWIFWWATNSLMLLQLLLATKTPADRKEKMWSQIESEMCLQRSKTIAQMCKTKQVTNKSNLSCSTVWKPSIAYTTFNINNNAFWAGGKMSNERGVKPTIGNVCSSFPWWAGGRGKSRLPLTAETINLFLRRPAVGSRRWYWRTRRTTSGWPSLAGGSTTCPSSYQRSSPALPLQGPTGWEPNIALDPSF